jgi:hypothetical protein
MFKMFNKKIVRLTYFMLILTAPVIYGSIVLHLFLDKNITILIDNELENSIEDGVSDSDIDDTDYSEIFTLSIADFIQDSPLFSFPTNTFFCVNTYCNACLRKQNPPP